MKHYIFRDNANGGRIALACDAKDDEDAKQWFVRYFGRAPSANIGMSSQEMTGQVGIACALPHSVGEKHLIKLAPDTKPKRIDLTAKRLPSVRLFPNVSVREFHRHCFYCGGEMTAPRKQGTQAGTARTMDHVTPRVRGGGVKVPCCHDCNQRKGQLKLEEYRVLVAYRNGLIPLEILQQVKFKGEELAEFEIDP
jgi:hypothetical protein